MKASTLSLFAATLIGLPASLVGQDDGLDIDELFQDDFEAERQVSINDPLEPVNRAIFKFNDGLYNKVVRPFSKAYARVMPDPVEKGITNVFENLEFPSRFTSNLLQGRVGNAAKETGKFLVNTTAGIGGIIRVSDEIDGLDIPDEDIGQAFASWGVGHGFYLVLPFMGPSSARDLVGDFADGAVEPIPTPWSQVDDSTDRLILRSIDIVNDLPRLMDVYDSMQRSAIDPYASVRDGYAQRRARQASE
ncbi:VacJ family lipoprotein [Pelagicoccus sp. SDUM812003]|uniref:MlaA family lipoprotein n=1 Tax=Pelagicoccus sp. SDUM812003 TaxID=3041267 RepID=UPI00280CFA2E|nr:VacJ family lipoprotein [Pelagicoccus sp. SDUM812003]MDQ8205348.1 VacJ family lipoprotein [Pelagicoccus sp. SDUM812003]